MAQRILVFEKNSDFIDELNSGFGRFGAELDIVTDPDAGLASAKGLTPDLVLLSVDAMAAPGEAFLVCKKFKSDSELKTVPFVIMGGEHHSDAFESHKKLKKRRADEYLQLPIGFDDLLTKVKPLVPLEEQNLTIGEEGENVDDEIDAFADNAFDDLMLEGEESNGAAQAAAPAPAEEIEEVGLDDLEVDLSDSVVQEVDEADFSDITADSEPAEAMVAAPEPVPEPEPEPEPLVEPEVHESQVDELKEQLRAAEQRADDAERALKRSERPRASASLPPSVSSRDYLELRETLNRKEKELLALKDEITARDKQLLDASDRALELEKANADTQDKMLSIDRELADAQDKIDALEKDKAASGKRIDDLKGRLARSDKKAKKFEEELDVAKSGHAEELSSLRDAHTAKLEEVENEAAATTARLRAEHAAEVESVQEAHGAELKKAEEAQRQAMKEASDAHGNEVESIKAANAASVQQLEEDHTAALSKQKDGFDADLARARADAAADKEQSLEALAREHTNELDTKTKEAQDAQEKALAGLRTELEKAQADSEKALDAKHTKELAVLGRKLSEAEANSAVLEERIEEGEQAKQDLETKMKGLIAGVEADLATRTEERDIAQNELSSARGRIEALEGSERELNESIAALEARRDGLEAKLDGAKAKIETDAELLERVRKALGIGIGLLDQQKNNSLPD